MTTATAKSMNLHLEKSSIMISAKVPEKMKQMMEEAADRQNMSVSQYMKLAINERLEKDLTT